MALVKCPGCGEEISSSANKCVNCGAEIVVCPDCGNVMFAGTSACKKCGCTIKPKVEEKTDRPEIKDICTAIRRFKQSPYGQNAMLVNKVFGILSKIVSAATLVVMAIAMYKIFSWSPDEKALEDLLHGKQIYSSLLMLVTWLFLFLVILIILDGYIPEVKSRWLCKIASAFLLEYEADCNAIMKSLGKYDSFRGLKDEKPGPEGTALYMEVCKTVHRGYKTSRIVYSVLYILSMVITFVAGLIAFKNSAIMLLNTVIKGQLEDIADVFLVGKYNFTPAIILGCIVLFVGLIALILHIRANKQIFRYAKTLQD